MRITTVPQIPSVTDNNVTDVARAIKGLLDVREGYVGDPLDANVTFRDLVLTGLASQNFAYSQGAPSPVLPVGLGPDGYDPTLDMSIPPAPAGLTISTGLTSAILKWNDWAYRNHAYTEVWRSAANTLSTAVLIGTSDTHYYVDAIGSTNKSYYYWIRFVSQANVNSPYNSSSGTLASTGLVGGVDLSDLIISSSKLADSAVTAQKIANLAVGNAAIANLAVTNAKIADLTIDNAKIASLDAAKINTGLLSADRIQAGSLDAKIANLDTAVITTGTFGSARIADASITSAKIASAIQSDNYSVGAAGWRFSKTGVLEINDGQINLKSAASGARMEMKNNVIKVFDAGGTLRVKIGDLAA